MSRIETVSHTIELVPTGYTGQSGLTANSNNPYTNGQNSSSNTSTYARIQGSSNNSQGYIYYTFTIPSIPSSATITSVTAKFRARFSNGSGVSGNAQLYRTTTAVGSATSVSGTTSNVYNIASASGWTASNITNLRLRVNTTRTSNNRYMYFYGADVTIVYTVNETIYEITASADSSGTVTPTSGEATAGSNYTLALSGAPYKVLDNNVDVTSQVVEATSEASSYTVTKPSGASYGFNQSGSSYVSANTGQNSSAAVGVITLTIRNNATVTISAVASSESGYDYCYLSDIGSTFSTSAAAESSYKWRGSGSDSSTVNYGSLTPGTYTIYAKYYKDQYEASGSDTFTFTVNISETVPPAGGYVYTINNVSADHTVVVQYNPPITYNISGTVASSLSVSPSLPQSIGQGSNFNLTITPTLPGTITVVDNNTATATYTIPLGNLSAKTYTITNVQAAHTLSIQFTELAKYNITGTVATGLSISPSLPVNNKYQGTDQIFTITPSEAGILTVNDNGTPTTYVIPRNNIQAVEYAISNIGANHTLTVTFEALQQYQISGTAASGLTLSPALPQTVYTGDDFTLTITPSAGGKVIVNDNGQDYIYTVSRTNVQPVYHYIANIAEAHVLNITYEAPIQYTVSGTVGSGVSISPSLPQSFYTGDNFALTITPSDAGIITVVDNDRTTTYQIVAGQVAAVIYNINGITESHTLAITFEALPQYTIVSGSIATGITINPSLPVTKYLGESQTFTITPSTSGTITVLENDVEKAIYYIIPGEVNSVSYSITNIAADHEIEIKFSELPEFTATASLTGTGNLSTNSITDYGGKRITFTITNVPSSNIIIAIQDGKNISDEVEVDGTTYTYTFLLVNNTSITFTSKVPQNVDVAQTIDQFGTINPSTTQSVLEGTEYTLQITPTDYQTTATAPLSVSDNYIEVSDKLETRHDTASSTLTASSQTTSGVSSNSGGLTNAVGKTAESPYSVGSTNAYASNGSTGYCIYSFNVSGIPSDATIKSVSCKVYGHAESTTYTEGSRECSLQFYNNTTAVGTKDHFTSTTNYILEMTNCGTWIRSDLNNIKLRCTVAYYGGGVGGISLTIEYEINAIRYYYTTTVYEAKTISVKYKPDFYVKVNNQWKGRTLTSMLPKINGKYVNVKKMYVKIGGIWKSVD